MRLRRAGLTPARRSRPGAEQTLSALSSSQPPGLLGSGPLASRTGAELLSIVEAIHSAALALLYTQITELPPKP